MTTITVQDLATDGIISSNWLRLRSDEWKRIANNHLAGLPGRWWEADVTVFMSLAMGALNEAMTRALCTTADVTYQNGFGLVSGHDFAGRSRAGRKSRRTIDLVIAKGWDVDTTPYEAHVAVEAKFKGSVNGKWGFCTGTHSKNGYSNQIICYPAGCTHEQLDTAENVKFVWLSNSESGSVLNARGALTQRDRDINKALAPGDKIGDNGRAFIAQQEAAGKWAMTTWEDLRGAVDHAFAGGEHDHATTALRRALTPESISRVRDVPARTLRAGVFPASRAQS